MIFNLTTYIPFIIFDSVNKTSQVLTLKASAFVMKKVHSESGGFSFAPLFPKVVLVRSLDRTKTNWFMPDKKTVKKRRRLHDELRII